MFLRYDDLYFQLHELRPGLLFSLSTNNNRRNSITRFLDEILQNFATKSLLKKRLKYIFPIVERFAFIRRRTASYLIYNSLNGITFRLNYKKYTECIIRIKTVVCRII